MRLEVSVPRKPPRPCSWPGCPALVPGRAPYCPPHLAEHRRRQDAARGTTAERGYGAVWRRIRARVLLEEPLCRFCAERGEITPAEVVDHIDGNTRNNARENLRPLCKRCHDARTARDQAFGRRLNQDGDR